MARLGVSITKRTLFRGVQQEFSNVYHYESGDLVVGDAAALLAAVKSAEVPFHSTDVTFVRGRVWEAGGTPGQNDMLVEDNFTGTGSQTPNSNIDRERAALVQWPAGQNTLGRPVYLRKWYHCCGNFAGESWAAATIANTAAQSTLSRNAMATAANGLRQLTVNAHVANLCAKSGRLTAAAAEMHPYLEHHQLGDQWR